MNCYRTRAAVCLASTGSFISQASAAGTVSAVEQASPAPLPAPIAGGGLLWLGVMSVAGVYLLLRRRARR